MALLSSNQNKNKEQRTKNKEQKKEAAKQLVELIIRKMKTPKQQKRDETGGM